MTIIHLRLWLRHKHVIGIVCENLNPARHHFYCSRAIHRCPRDAFAL
jgi:hypothetical protein